MLKIENQSRKHVSLLLMAVVFVAVGISALLPKAVWAAGDHGPAPSAVSIAPRSDVRFGNQQLVALYAGERLFVFLEGFSDGRPTRGAVLEALINFLPEELTEIAPGTYRSGPISLSSGRNDIELSWRIGAQEDMVPITLQIPGRLGAGNDLSTVPAPKIPGWVFLLLAGFLYVGVMGLFWHQARTRRAAAAMPPHHAPHAAE
ncbi:MAG: hypothetical protein KJ904_06960 [Alphaproteobacteria bacterium]|nr:hypothetical protein [Alphaproteobacteria bacterium]MBU0797344.1 hypothetical protein [Alphaproteobacteria bacterium]MBU0886888.1 hypothetical protein [Alphaproteobacteria bacterium]MBU1812369.1 hypothetical protein [Alphaproteobacteria bacterium]